MTVLLDVFLVVAWTTMFTLPGVTPEMTPPRWSCLCLESPWSMLATLLDGMSIRKWLVSAIREARWVFPRLTGLPAIRMSIGLLDPNVSLTWCGRFLR